MNDISRNAYLDEAAEHYKTRLKYYDIRWALRNLMAVINRDGGHRADVFGTDTEAAEDCQRTVVNLLAKLAELEGKNQK